MVDFLNIHMAQLLIGVGAMMWIYVTYSDSGDSDVSENSDDESDGESVVSVTAGVVEKFKHL